VSHAESLPVVFINNELQLVNKHTNTSLEEKKLKTQYSLTILSDDQCAHHGGHNQQGSAVRVKHQQERDRIQQEHFNREGNIAYFQHVGITPSFDIARTGALRPSLRANAQHIQLFHPPTEHNEKKIGASLNWWDTSAHGDYLRAIRTHVYATN